MVFEMFHRKRSPESSSSEPPKKFPSRELRASSVASHGSWSYENTSRRTNYSPKDDLRSERSSTKNDFERRLSSSEARMNPFLQSPPREHEEDLEPPGTGSSTLQYTLTSRVSFLTWKDILYRELEDLNCLFTVEPNLRKKANMTPESELTYRKLAKAIIGMRLDNAHLALVSNVEDPLKMMKVLADFREPENRHLERRAQQRLNSTVYHETIPVRDFLRIFENLLREVEKYSGERMSDNKMKQQLLSAIIGDFPNILVGSKVSSNEIRYDELKKLLIEAVDRRTAAKKVEVNENQSASKKIEMKPQRTGKVDEQRTTSTNAAVSHQGLESRIGTSKIVEVKDRRPIGSNAGTRNVEVKEQHSTSSNCASNNAVVKEQHSVAENQRPSLKNTDGNQVAGKNVEENKWHSVGATSTHQSSVKNDRRPIISSPAADEWQHTVQDTKGNVKSLKDERSLPAGDVKVSERRSIANSSKDERLRPVSDANANERRSMTKSAVNERPSPAGDARRNDRRPGTNAAGKNTDAEDPRPAGTCTKVDEQRTAIRNIDANQRRLASSDAVGKNADADERYSAAKTSGMNERYTAVADSNVVNKSGALYERRAPKPSAPIHKDELEEQLELDRRIQELIETNSRLASKEISCTRCGAYGHVVGDCKRKDNRRKCYSCLQFVDDHVASTCPYWNECAAMPKNVQSRTNSKFTQESKSMPSPPPFVHSRFFADNGQFPVSPEILDDDDDEDDDDLPLVDGLRQVYHIRRRVTTKKLKTGRTARKDLIFTDSDFYTDVEYREMFIEEDEEEPGDIILETIKVMSTNPK